MPKTWKRSKGGEVYGLGKEAGAQKRGLFGGVTAEQPSKTTGSKLDGRSLELKTRQSGDVTGI